MVVQGTLLHWKAGSVLVPLGCAWLVGGGSGSGQGMFIIIGLYFTHGLMTVQACVLRACVIVSPPLSVRACVWRACICACACVRAPVRACHE